MGYESHEVINDIKPCYRISMATETFIIDDNSPVPRAPCSDDYIIPQEAGSSD
jgi:hypothetical protein